nr:helix-turn-helix domain-containing protein [Streptomyces microflavus]
MADQAGPEPTVSVQRDLRLLEAAGAHPAGAPAQQLAREAELPPAMAGEHLRTLAEDGYLRELDDGAYALPDQGRSPGTGPGTGAWTEHVRPS